MATSRQLASKKNDIYSKKIKPNPKYENVKATLDTGASLSKYLRRCEELKKNYRFRNDETFKRMKVSTFAQLILQVAEVVNIELEKQILQVAESSDDDEEEEEEEEEAEMERSSLSISNEEKCHNGGKILADLEDADEPPPLDTERSTLHNVLRGVGEMELHEQNCNAILEAISPSDEVAASTNKNNSTQPRLGNVSVPPAVTARTKKTKKKETAPIFDPTCPDPTCLPFLLLDVRDKDAYNECHIIGADSYPSALARSDKYLRKDIFAFKNKPGKLIIIYDDGEKVAPEVATVMVQRDIDNVMMLSGGIKVLNKKFSGCFLSGTLPSTCFSPVPTRKGKKPKPAPVVTENEGVIWYTSELLEKIHNQLDSVLTQNETSRMSSQTNRSTSRKSTTSSTNRQSVASQKSWR